jgi:hypothetical protein
VLSPRPARTAAALVLLCACGAAAGENAQAQPATVGPRDILITSADGEVCVASQTVPRPCVPVVSSGEPVVSASLAPIDATAGLVMVLTRPDVVVTGLGAGATRTAVRSGGTELLVWLRMVPVGTDALCASYRAPEGGGRLVVHRTLTLAASEAGAVEPEPDDAC